MKPGVRGFTFIELALTIFILSLLVSIAMPAFSRLAQNSLKSEAKQVASVLRSVTDDASATKRNIPLLFDFRHSLIIIKSPALNGEQSGAAPRRFEISSLQHIRIPSQGIKDEGEFELLMSPLGPPEDLIVRLKGDEAGYDIKLSRVSGRVKILEIEVLN